MAFFRKNVTKSREIKTKESRETEVVTKPKVAKVETIKPKPATPKPKKSSTVISKGIRVEGNISGGDFVQIDGVLNGDVTAPNVNIGMNGSVHGVVKADSVIIDGKVKGEVYSKELEVRKTGQVYK